MKKTSNYLLPFCLFFFAFQGECTAQFSVTTSSAHTQLVDTFTGPGMAVSNVTFTGSPAACGYFSNGNLTNLGTAGGIVLSTGYVSDINLQASWQGASVMGSAGNLLIASLAGTNTYDAAVLDFDFVPDFDTVSFQFHYASEDYPEWVGGSPLYQDYACAFISGPNPNGGNYTNVNMIWVPSTNNLIIPNTINNTLNAQYYIGNATGPVVYDGFTTLLSASMNVVPGGSYHMTIGIADGGDPVSDAGLFLKYGSLESHGTNTGISQVGEADAFSVYPNPAGGDFIFYAQTDGLLTLSDCFGRTVKTIEIRESKTFIPGNDIAKGIYLLSFQTQNGITTGKLIMD